MSEYTTGFTTVQDGNIVVSYQKIISDLSFRVWIEGNGVDTYTVSEVYYQQGLLKVYVTCGGSTSFKVPALGRWSDLVTLTGFDIETHVTVCYTVSGTFPVSSANPAVTNSGFIDVQYTPPDRYFESGEPGVIYAYDFTDASPWTVIPYGGASYIVSDTGTLLYKTSDAFGNVWMRCTNPYPEKQIDFFVIVSFSTTNLSYSVANHYADNITIGLSNEFFSTLSIKVDNANAYVPYETGGKTYSFDGTGDFVIRYDITNIRVAEDDVIDFTRSIDFNGIKSSKQVESSRALGRGLVFDYRAYGTDSSVNLSYVVAVYRTPIDTAVATSTGLILVSSNDAILDGDMLVIDGVEYFFVTKLTGRANEILIGYTAVETALHIAQVLSNTAGGLVSAVSEDYIVVVEYLSNDVTWAENSDGIELTGFEVSYLYTQFKAAATLPSMQCYGYIPSSDGVGGILPHLTSAGATDSPAFTISYSYLPSLESYGRAPLASITSTSTSTEKVAMLQCSNEYMEYYAGLITSSTAYDDIALDLVTYVATVITYTAEGAGLDVWKAPQQTLLDGYGDCEDGAFLLFSLMVNAGIPSSRVRFYAGYLYGTLGHAWIAYLRESDNKWIFLDWTAGTQWLWFTDIDQVPLAYYDDYEVYTSSIEYFSCGQYVTTPTLLDYINSIVGLYTEDLEYPEYTVEATMDTHATGEVEYPEYEVDGYTGATTYSDEPYDELNYPDYTVEATGYGNSIGHNIVLDYPDYTVTGTMSSETFIYAEEDNIDYPDYEVTGTMYVVASMNVSLTYPIHVINLHCLEVVSSVPVEWDGTEPHTAIRLNTVNFAASRYSNFRFNSMCNFMGEIICANSSGIFKHTGGSDNTVDIDAYFQLPSADYSTHKAKSYRKIYLEGYLEGEITVTTVVDDVYGSQLNIASLGAEAEVQHVFERQKDDRGNLIGLRVANNDGKDFTINSIYATLVVSSTLPNGYTGLGRIKFSYPTYEVSASAS